LAARDPNARKVSASDIAKAELEKADWERALVEGRQLHEKREKEAKAAEEAAERARIAAEEAAIKAKQDRLEGLRSDYLHGCIHKASAFDDLYRGTKIPLDECVELNALNMSVQSEDNALAMVTELICHGISLHQKVKMKLCNMIVLGQISKVHDDVTHFDVALINRQEMIVKNSDETPLPCRLGKFCFGLGHYHFGRQGKQICTLMYEDKFYNADPDTTKLMRKNNYAVSVINQRAQVEASPREPKEVSIMKCIKVEKTQILPQPLLVTAPPGGGKTVFANQLMHSICTSSIILKQTGVVPVLLPAASVARWVMSSANFDDSKLDQMSFFGLLKSMTFDEETVGILWRARCEAKLLVLVDAVDELSGPSKPLVERFICKVLAREMKVVVFARDGGYDSKIFAFFQRIRLHGMSAPQQHTIIQRTLEGMAHTMVATGGITAAEIAHAASHSAAARLLNEVWQRCPRQDHLTSAMALPLPLLALVAMALTQKPTGLLGDSSSGDSSSGDSGGGDAPRVENTIALPGLDHNGDLSLAMVHDTVLDACVARAVERAEKVEKVSAAILREGGGKSVSWLTSNGLHVDSLGDRRGNDFNWNGCFIRIFSHTLSSSTVHGRQND
jgi:hypothetical protein